MNRLTNILALVLAAQLLLSAALFWPREDAGESDARAVLLDVATDTIDQLEISDGDTTLLLRRENGHWIFPDFHGLPAERARLDRALIDLPSLARGWPVADSETAAARFDVAEESFQRRISFSRGEQLLGTLYVGSSPGFRKVHVRRAGEDAVYAVEFNTFELPTSANELLDKTLLGLSSIGAVTGLDFALTRDGDSWASEADIAPAADVVEGLVNGLRSLRVSGVADTATAELLDQLEAPPTLVVSSGERRHEYRLYEIEDSYFVRRDDIPVYFSLGAFDYDRLNDVNAESLYPVEDSPAVADDPTTGETD